MQERARGVRASLGKAQSQANALVDAALRLKACGATGSTCDLPGHLDSAIRPLKGMTDLLRAAHSENYSLREITLQLRVDPKWVGVDAERALRFERLLRDFPDAKALVGADSYAISASTKGSTASLRLSRGDFIGGARQSLVISTPLGDKKQVSLYDRADGLAGTAQATLATEFGNVKWPGAVLTLFGAGFTFGREERTYLVDGAAPREEKVSVHPLAFKLTSASYSLGEGHRNTHVFALEWQRTHEDGDKAIRCPVPGAGATFLDCLQGTVGAPKRTESGLISYQYRKIWERYAAAPQISFNTRSRVVDLDVPLYLVRSADDKERPFNAGVSLGWASKGKTAVTDRTSSQFRVGVFIGAPFSLTGQGGD
jgi:hypothetical protein